MSKGNTEDIYPLSPMQAGMLFHTLYAPESRAYFVQESYVIQGSLDTGALKRAWQQVLERHAVLRTSFFWKRQGAPLQIVSSQVKLPWDEHDWRTLAPREQQERLRSFLEADREQGFDLSRPPLFRVTLIRTAGAEYQFIWRFHHLVLDMWSVALLMKEVFLFYTAYKQGQDLLMGPPRPYRDYIGWLRRQDLSRAESFWRKRLEGFRAPTPLKSDRAQTSTTAPEKSYGKQSLKLSAAATARLQTLARQRQLTMNTLVQGAWALLLSRYSGEADVLFGTPVSGRPLEFADADSMVGMFINTLPVRVRSEPRAVIIDWLKNFQSEQVETRQYVYSPLVQIHGWSEVPRSLPLFESLLVFENLPEKDPAPDGKTGLRINFENSFDQSQYPLVLVAWPQAELSLEIWYDAGRFDSATVEQMLRHYQLLLEGFAANPEKRLSDLSLLTEAEREQIIHDWNSTHLPFPHPHLLHHLFHAQVSASPSAIALCFLHHQLSFLELNHRANQLAHLLLSQGLSSDSTVAILCDRSVELVVALLATLKAGAAYLPLDPTHPPLRLSLMLTQAAPSILLTQEHLLARLPQHSQPTTEQSQSTPTTESTPQVICLDSQWPLLASHSTDNPELALWPENLAYVIYTSGSTGTPKGAMNTHLGICNRLLWMQLAYPLDSSDAVLQKTTISFDVSVWEFFWPLIVGARLVLAEPGGHRDSAYLVKLISEQQITTLHFVPSMLKMFLEEEGLEQLRSLRRVISSGEALERAEARRFRERLPDCELHNLYGPTEAAVDVTAWACEGEESEEEGVPIGRPIANTQIYILDEEMEVVPVGVEGELYIGGIGLARGYLKQADRTAERFVPDPYSGEGGGRLYRTGDVGRYGRRGEVEYVGRVDEQVKVRGQRVELGEVEAVLGSHGGVRAAAVVMREDEAGVGADGGVGVSRVGGGGGARKRMVGYVEVRDEVREEELRRYMRERVPEYMMPEVIVRVGAMPLTASGKIDRRALPAPELRQSRLAESFLPARTPVEEVLTNIWAEVLGLEQVGIADNFFELGGHSLLATQVLMRVRETLRVEMPLRILFEQPTVSDFAQGIEEARRAGQGLEIPVIEPAPRDRQLPLSFAQQRLWFLDQLEPGNTAYNIPIAARLTGRLEVEALRASLDEVVRRHEVLRTNFAAVEGMPVQVINPPKPLMFLVEDLTGEGEREAEVLRRAKEEAHRPFELSRDALLRVRLLRLAEEEHVVLLTMHHIVSDGWSMGVLFGELAALYAAFHAGAPSPLPELPIQYADFAVWQRGWLTEGMLARELSYWQQHLGAAPPVLRLPEDGASPAVENQSAASEQLALSPELSEALHALCRRTGVTLFMTLLASLQVLLRYYTGQDDIIIGTDIANRNRPETEKLIGFFINMLPLRTDLSGDPTFGELLKRVREVCLNAYAHQDVPFMKIVEGLRLEREPGRNPLFQVVLVLQNFPHRPVEVSGTLVLEPLDVPTETAKFDLQLTLGETTRGISGQFEFNRELFGASTRARLAGHFQTLLASVVAQPDIRVSTLVEQLQDVDKQQQAVSRQEFRESRRRKLKDMIVEPVGGLTQKG
jgi:amino acid adenylation domain-containing protein